MNTEDISTYQTKGVLALKKNEISALPVHCLLSRNAQHSTLAGALWVCSMTNQHSYKPVTGNAYFWTFLAHIYEHLSLPTSKTRDNSMVCKRQCKDQ